MSAIESNRYNTYAYIHIHIIIDIKCMALFIELTYCFHRFSFLLRFVPNKSYDNDDDDDDVE